MKQQENISRRDALKRMSKVAMAVAAATMLPNVTAIANSTNHSGQYSNYVDRCYNDYSNHNDYSNYKNYGNYSDYRDYNNYNDYKNYNDYQNASI